MTRKDLLQISDELLKQTQERLDSVSDIADDEEDCYTQEVYLSGEIEGIKRLRNILRPYFPLP